MTDPIALAKALLAAPSVTPATGVVFDVLEAALTPVGFVVERFLDGTAPDGPVENLLAVRGTGRPHLAFAGHVDVVPPGRGWTTHAFAPEVRGGMLFGRGAVDMKGAVAAWIAALDRPGARRGTQSLLITGDEEGPATHGTVALLDRIVERRLVPDACVVGEPTSDTRLGDTVKIGRRGSVNIWIEVHGRQGHVAYPHLADNPIPRLVAALAAIDAIALDDGTEWFQPSNIEITDLDVGNPATNVIPARAAARLSIRFNDLHTGAALTKRIAQLVAEHAPGAQVISKISGEAFRTDPGALSHAVTGAIETVTGLQPQLSTTGGTSDARFISRHCPVVEFGLLNATMHKLDEAVALADLETLAAIYAEVIRELQPAA